MRQLMKPVNMKATRIFDALITRCDEEGGYIKVDNSNGTYMPLSVEKVGPDKYSFAHYYEQGGDLMADPEIVLWKNDKDGRLYPTYFKQAPYFDHELVVFEGNEPVRYARAAQRDCATFCGTWATNIKDQQRL